MRAKQVIAIILIVAFIGCVVVVVARLVFTQKDKIEEIEKKYDQQRAALRQKMDSLTTVAVEARAERDSANAKTNHRIDSVNVLRKRDAIAYQKKIARLETRTVKQLEYEADSLYNARVHNQ